MDPSSFATRLAYSRFLYHFRHGEAPSNAAIGKAADRTGQWVTEIAKKAEPPTDWRVHKQLSGFFGVPEAWLFRNEGAAPQPELWGLWLEQRTGVKKAAPQAATLPPLPGVERIGEPDDLRDQPWPPPQVQQRPAAKKRGRRA